MSFKDNDELRQLFDQFVTEERAKDAMDDIKAGDRILRENPAPQPRLETLLRIKAEGAARLRERRRRRVWRRRAVEAIAAAAVLAILMYVGSGLLESPLTVKPEIVSVLPKAIWETYDVGKEDPALASLATEIEVVEQQFRALESPVEQSRSAIDEVSELEIELLELEGEFWKG